MYLKKINNPVTSTEDAAISIDISSDEEDNDKQDKASAVQADTTKATLAKQPSAAVSVTSNGSKSSDTNLHDLISKMRPGPASQKKRRLETLDESQAQSTSGTSQQQRQATPASKPKKFKKEVFAKMSSVTFADVGGLDQTLSELCELILHIKHPEMYRKIGLPAPRGFLLHGAPGTGKTLLANAIAGQLDVLLVEVPASEIVAGVSGESEERIREIFEQAAAFAPCVLFIDEIDSISSNRQTAQKDMERRIVAQLLSSLDNLSKLKYGDQVLVIGATNRADSLDPALRRVGRFDHEISLGTPDRNARSQILQIISRNLELKRPFDFDEIAAITPGYVGADLLALATRAASTAIKRVLTGKVAERIDESLKESKEPKPDAAPPVVNIDDDSLLMEVDAEAVSTTENKPEAEIESEKTAEVEAKSDESAENKDVDDTTSKVDSTEIEAPKNGETMDTDVKPEETLIDVIKKQPDVKFQLTLDHKIKWLENDVQPMTDDELEKLKIERQDFIEALKHVQPSAKREGFITVPDVTWDDIGSLQDIRNELKLAILAPVKFPRKLARLGLQSPSGVLLCGPPGCGKTLLAKAVANEAGINFISVKGPELLNMVK